MTRVRSSMMAIAVLLSTSSCGGTGDVGVTGAKPEIWTLGHRDSILANRFLAIDRGITAGGGDAIEYIQRGCTYPWPSAAANSPLPLFQWATPVRPLTAYLFDGTTTPSDNGDLLVGSENYAGIIQMRWNGTSFVELGRLPLPTAIQKLGRVGGKLYGLEFGHSGRLVRIGPSY